MNGFRMLVKRFIHSISRWKMESVEQTHWVNHICDEYRNASQKAVGMYANIHGFEEAGGIYWIGIDIRFIGIRCADIVIKCKNKSTYDYWLNKTLDDLDSIPQAVREASELFCLDGDDVETQFIFRWGDEDKSFNVRFATDRYAEEK